MSSCGRWPRSASSKPRGSRPSGGRTASCTGRSLPSTSGGLTRRQVGCWRRRCAISAAAVSTRTRPSADRLREISERLTVVGQDFSRNIRDDVGSIRITPDRLAGLPQDFIDAHPPDDDGLVTITTDYPDWIPFRTFARDAAARRELATVFLYRAWPQNDALLHELLELRAEQATLLGYSDWPDFDAEVKMIGSGKAIAEFIDRIAALAEARGPPRLPGAARAAPGATTRTPRS